MVTRGSLKGSGKTCFPRSSRPGVLRAKVEAPDAGRTIKRFARQRHLVYAQCTVLQLSGEPGG